MGNPIINRTVIVPAGTTGTTLDVPGRFVKIVSCSVASVLMGFDASTPERVYPDDCYAGPVVGFHNLRFIDDIGAGSTVVVQIAEQPIIGGSMTSLIPVEALLTTIRNRLAAATVRTIFPETAVGLAGAATQIFAANAARKKAQVQAGINNTGRVWVGSVAGVTQVASFFELLPGASSPIIEDTIAIFACSENGTEVVRAYETT